MSMELEITQDGIFIDGCRVTDEVREQLLSAKTLIDRENILKAYRHKQTSTLITTGNKPAEGANPSVDHPAHYNQHPSGVECIDIVRWMGFNLGNVVKYLWRDGLKDTEVELQDLEKAAWYLYNGINRRKANDNSTTQ